jgi:hypothetical protein
VGPGACEAPKRGILDVGYDLFTCVINQSIPKEAIVLNMNDMQVALLLAGSVPFLTLFEKTYQTKRLVVPDNWRSVTDYWGSLISGHVRPMCS